MKSSFLALLLGVALSALALDPAAAQQRIAYPTADEPIFTITIPDEWELTQAEDLEDYFIVEGPTGALLFFRAIPSTIEESVQESITYLGENFEQLELSEPQEIEMGEFAALVANGTGTDPEEDLACKFGMAWIAYPDGTVAEIWFETLADDAEGSAEAKAILDSFTPVE